MHTDGPDGTDAGRSDAKLELVKPQKPIELVDDEYTRGELIVVAEKYLRDAQQGNDLVVSSIEQANANRPVGAVPQVNAPEREAALASAAAMLSIAQSASDLVDAFSHFSAGRLELGHAARERSNSMLGIISNIAQSAERARSASTLDTAAPGDPS